MDIKFGELSLELLNKSDTSQSGLSNYSCILWIYLALEKDSLMKK